MRELTDHVVKGDSINHQLKIEVQAVLGSGGAHYEYLISGPIGEHVASTRISFQNGPIREAGVNGITQEALLAVVIDRLRAFQAGPFATDDNKIALDRCREALHHLQARTRKRIERGVEGTLQK